MQTLYILLGALLGVVSGLNKPSYLVLVPKTLRQGDDLNINVFIYNAKSPATVTASIRGYSNRFAWSADWAAFSASSTAQGVQEAVLRLKVPPFGIGRYAYLHVRGTGGVSFYRYLTTYNIQEKQRDAVYIQTDKGIYKPGQTVKFRVFGTLSDLRPNSGNINVFITDPKGNKIKQLLNQRPTTGVVSDQLVMSDQPVLGEWKIKADLQGVTKEVTFGVGEYVLPKHNVKVILPSFAVVSDSEVIGHVEAKYTHGKDLTGKAVVKAWMEGNWRYPTRNLPTEHSFQIDGTKSFRFPVSVMKSFGSLQDRILVVQANVTDVLTGKSLVSQARVKFFAKRARLEWDSSNVNYFKPGLKYQANVKLLNPDNTPLSSGNRQVTVRKTFYLGLGDPYHPRYGTRKEPEETLTVDRSGILPLDFPVDHNAGRVSIEVTYKGDSSIYLSQTISTMVSPTGSYLQVSASNSGPTKAGYPVNIDFNSTTPIRNVSYMIFGRGGVVSTGETGLSSGNESTAGSVMITTTRQMVPSARLFVYYFDSEDNMVADMAQLEVHGAFANEVRLTMNTSRAEPGDHVGVTVSADKGSFVGISAIDQSSLLLRSPNGVSAAQVLTQLRREIKWSGDIGGRNPKTILQNSDFWVVSDGSSSYYSLSQPHPADCPPNGWNTGAPSFTPGQPSKEPTFFPLIPTNAPTGSPGVPTNAPTSPLPTKSPVLAKPSRIRKSFPETWLWIDTTLNSSSLTVASQVPDTITSWVASAFALHQTSGLGILDSPYKLDVFRPFFVTLNLPYSVIRGEEVVLQATVFNYLSHDTNVVVTLEASPDFDVTVKNSTGHLTNINNFTATSSIHVPAGKGRTALLPITPLALGPVSLKLKAQSALAADAVRKNLLVEAEGVEQEYTESFLINLKANDTFKATMPIEFPPSLVPDSGRVVVTAQGDLMGPTIANLDKLLKMPYGCGEQNMINFVPNIFITRYLTATRQLTDAIKEKAINFMTKGYQRELTYQHYDGSFSAFGNRDRSGSMWLTAFVVKSFQQAKPYIYIEDGKLEKAVNWIIQRQNPDGSFPEPGRVLHQSLKGGSASGDTLSAYVVSALLELENLSPSLERILKTFLPKALSFLEANLNTTTDPYALSLMQYAFTMAKLPAPATAVGTKLEALAFASGGKKHWEKAVVARPSKSYWRPRHVTSKAINVEMTAYNLLTYAERRDVTGGLPILRWLTEQRNGQGGFVSTQDTVMALQALGEFSSVVYSAGQNMNLHVKALPETHQFSISSKNALVLQSFEPTKVPSEVAVTATGPGIALVQVTVTYNVLDVPLEPAFALNTTVLKETKEELLLKVCISYTHGSESGMAVVEQGVLSGFELDQESIGSVPGLKRTETQNTKTVLYFDSFDATPVCYTVSMVRTDLVAKTKPAAIKVYDYYSPDEQTTVYYTSKLLENTNICDICTECYELCG